MVIIPKFVSPAQITPINFQQEFPIQYLQVDGDIEYDVKAGTQTDTKIRLKGKGVPSLRDPKRRGDHYVTLVVQTPTKLSREARKALEEFDRLCNK